MTLKSDLKFAARQLSRHPGYALTVIVTLALGIGANTAIFSVINSVLLSKLPVRDPQQLVFLTNSNEQGLEIGFGDGNRDFVTYPEFQQLERNHQVFAGLLAASSYTPRIPVELQTTDSGTNGTPAY